MPLEETIDDSRKNLRLTLELISQHGLTAEPLTYSIWYEYASGKNADLNAAIDRHLESKKSFTEEVIQKLFNQYIAESQIKLTEVVREELKKLFAEIIEAIKATSQHFSESENQLENINQALLPNLTEADVDLLVEQIKHEIKRLESTSSSLKEQLQQATREIDQLKSKMAQYRNEAFIDPLTRIDNRRGFEEKLESVIDESKSDKTPLCLIMADIDHFKQINDTHGHLVGDNVLRVVAATMKNAIRGKDLVARIGGEEFAVLLPDTPFEGGLKVAKNLQHTFECIDLKRKNNRESLGKISLSFGVTAFRKDDTVERFLQRADEALYHSKKAGRNRVSGL